MASIEQDVEVDVPVRTAYDQWTQFEQFPRFMDGVQDVRQLDDAHLHWVARIGGVEKEWDAEITAQEPDRVIAWRSTDGTWSAGTVLFEPVDATCTRIRLRMEWEPEGFIESAGSALGLDSMRVRGDLMRFKELVEERGDASGAWRGEVHGGTAAPAGMGGEIGLGGGTSGSIETPHLTSRGAERDHGDVPGMGAQGSDELARRRTDDPYGSGR